MADERHDQTFFLDLAAKGKDAWNAWRRDPANKDVQVTFAGIDFSEAPRDGIDFSGFEFGHHADFSGCKWRGVERKEIEGDTEAFRPGRAYFTSANFGYSASFDSATFGDVAYFSAAAFGSSAIFTRATFGEWASFARAAFGWGASFDRAAFGDRASFIGARFGRGASFTGAAYGDHAMFTGATFGEHTHFFGAAFGDEARFDGAAFGGSALFTFAAFGEHTLFTGAAFGDRASFDATSFKGSVEFAGRPKEQWNRDLVGNADEKGEDARLALAKRYKELWTRYDTGPDCFLIISFTRARFDGEADFSGRSFERAADFTRARFYSPPDFDAATKDARIDFTSAHIGFVPSGHLLHWTSDAKVPFRLRALRKIADETKNHDLERDLYIEERKAERGVYWHQLSDELKVELRKKLEDINKEQRKVWSDWRHRARARIAHRLGIAVKIERLAVHGFWIAVMGVYWGLADYGRSFARPAAWLIACGFFFYLWYSKILAQLMAKAPDVEKYKQAVRMLALGNTVPFVGPLTIDSEIKRLLFCPGCNDKIPAIPPEGYQFLVLSQNLLSIILVFFIGLALRNYFRIK